MRDLIGARGGREIEALVELVAAAERAANEIPCCAKNASPFGGGKALRPGVIPVNQIAQRRVSEL